MEEEQTKPKEEEPTVDKEEKPKPYWYKQEEETTDIDEDEIEGFKDGFKDFFAFCKRNHYQIIAVGMLLMALVGMWYTFKLGFMVGATTICKNSGGEPLLKNSNDIKDGQCLIKYDNLGGHNNNLGLTDEQVKQFEEGLT